MDNKSKKILIVLVILFVVLIIISAVLSYITKKNGVVTEENQIQMASEKLENKTLNKLANMDEMERMKFYLTEFVRAIENKEYEEAYGFLNEDFKKNFFKTYDEFEEYVSSKFPSMMSIQYDNFERNGDIYIFWITLRNPLTSDRSDGIEMNFVIKENDLNNFEMSFSVI